MIVNNTTEEKKNFYIFLLIITGLTSLMIYCYMPLDKINPGHDYLFHYKRMLSLMESLKENGSLIYIDNEALNNYGYATKWFYPDFVLIPFAIIGNIFGITTAFKVMYFVMTLLCGIFTYICVNRILKNSIIATFSGLMFAFCTYRLQDLYERGALGESLSFTFVPIVIWGLYEIIKGNYKKWYIISIGFSLMIFTHMISTVLMFVTVLIFLIIYYKNLLSEPKRIVYLIVAGIVSIILSGYFLFPFIEQLVSNKFYFQSVENGASTYDSVPIFKIVYGMFSIGLPFVKSITFYPQIGLVLTLGIVSRFFIKNKPATIKKIDTIVIIGLVYILIGFSSKIWGYYPLKALEFIQFPWRLFEFSSFLFAIAAGYYITTLLKNKYLIGYAILVCLIISSIIFLSKSYKDYNDYDNHTIPEETFANQYLYLMGYEYIPSKIEDISSIESKSNTIATQHPYTKLTNYQKEKNSISFDITVNNPELAELPLIYYKGYVAKINNETIPIKESNNGFVEVPIEKTGHIEVSFTGTSVQKYSIYITLISYLFLGIYIVIENKKKKNA